MSWQLDRRENEWHVVNEDGTSVGAHGARVDAIKHQRALYAREELMASMYAILDSQHEALLSVGQAEEVLRLPEVPAAAAAPTSPVMAEILALLAREQQEKSLVASVAEQQTMISQQFQEAAAERQALVAALGRMGSPTINLPTQPAPEVTVNVPPAEVNFHAPAPSVNVHVPPAEVTVNTPDIHVNVEAPPPVQKTMKMVRDPLTHEVTSVEVTEQ